MDEVLYGKGGLIKQGNTNHWRTEKITKKMTASNIMYK